MIREKYAEEHYSDNHRNSASLGRTAVCVCVREAPVCRVIGSDGGLSPGRALQLCSTGLLPPPLLKEVHCTAGLVYGRFSFRYSTVLQLALKTAVQGISAEANLHAASGNANSLAAHWMQWLHCFLTALT